MYDRRPWMFLMPHGGWNLADTMEEIHEPKNGMKFSFQHVLR